MSIPFPDYEQVNAVLLTDGGGWFLGDRFAVDNLWFSFCLEDGTWIYGKESRLCALGVVTSVELEQYEEPTGTVQLPPDNAEQEAHPERRPPSGIQTLPDKVTRAMKADGYAT